MNSPSASLFRLEAALRWTARVLTLLLIGVILAILVGEGFNPLNLKGIEVPQMALFWTACIGMVLAWRWQAMGALLSVGGLILFFAVECAVTGRLPKGLFFYLMLLPGILFLMSSVINRRMQARVGS
jgi:hypothetical protein